MFWWQKTILVIVAAAALFFTDKAGFFDASAGLINRFVLGPAARAVFYLGEEGGFIFKNIFGIRNLIKENVFLKNQRDFFRAEYFNLLSLKEENEFLRQALSVKRSDSRRVIVANILSFDPFEAGDALILDKGVADGVAAGDTVVLPGNILVGRVGESKTGESRIVLISSPESRVTSVTENGEIKGVVTGSASGALALDLVLKEASLQSGQILLSSGLDGFFERGLLVGEVTRVINDDSAPFQKATVRPFFKNRDLKQVFIIVD